MFLVANLMLANPAQAITFDYTWKGNAGYSAQGSFSYDETQHYSVVTPKELTSLKISFFDPLNHLLKTYVNIENGADKGLNSFLQFNFNPATKSLTGSFDVGEGDMTGEKDFYLKGEIKSGLELRNLDTHVLDSNTKTITLKISVPNL